MIPSGFKGILIWLIVMGIVSVAVTLRHVVCFLTGLASDSQDVFREYLISVYQSYRFSAVFLSAIIYSDLLCELYSRWRSYNCRSNYCGNNVSDKSNKAINNIYKQEYFNILFDFIPLCAGNSSCFDNCEIFYRSCLDWLGYFELNLKF